METVRVTLGEREYEIVPLPIKANRAWRRELGQPLQQLMGILAEADELKLDSPADLVRILEIAQASLLGAPDLIFEAVCRYCPAINHDRELIEEAAFEAELMDVFVEVLKIVFPFGRLLSIIRGSQNG
jgi:hypothetical protein